MNILETLSKKIRNHSSFDGGSIKSAAAKYKRYPIIFKIKENMDSKKNFHVIMLASDTHTE